jgi:hypothetical protein
MDLDESGGDLNLRDQTAQRAADVEGLLKRAPVKALVRSLEDAPVFAKSQEIKVRLTY